MRKESRRARAALSVILLATAVVCDYAQGGQGSVPLSSVLPQEAAASVFSAKLGTGPDDDAELLVGGSWSASVLASIDLQALTGSSLGLASAQPLLFTQSPDLSLSFLLYKRIFVEARVANDVSQASYAAGYRGGRGELLREFRVGNAGISFPSLPFLAFGEGSYRSFGAAALVQSESFTGRAMVRYDQADRVVRRFVGSTEVVDTTIAANAFIAGQYFLTRSSPGANLSIFVQSVSGSYSASDGNRYRKLDASEYSYSAITGLVGLTFIATTRVLAYYSASGGDGISISGIGDCDFLYQPPPVPSTGALLPKLQVLNRYGTTATPTSAEAFVLNPSSGLRDTDFSARIDPAGFVEVTRAAAEQPSPSDLALREAYRRPFDSSSYPGMPWLYTTDFASDTKTGQAPVFTRSIVVRAFSASARITIDKDIVAGSVEVTRDGLPDYSFSVDSDKGFLTLVPPPGPTNEIVVSYMKQSSERKSGNLAGALGGFWDLGEDWRAWTALGASWSLPGTSYASDSRTNAGSINLTAGELNTKGAFTHNAAIAARYSQDDATGLYRVEGMESNSGYSSSFMQQASTMDYYSVTETTESDLASSFPKLVQSLHSDGSVQQALRIVQNAVSPPASAPNIYKVEGAPPYAAYKTFSFFAKLPPTALMTLSLDDGAATAISSVKISLPAGSGTGSWRRYLLHYGGGDAKLYAQDGEGSPEIFLGVVATAVPSLISTGSRLVISVSGLAALESVWVDEILFQDSVGRTALLFQGQAAYSDPAFALAPGNIPLLSGLELSGDAQAALDSAPYASGGGQIESTLLFARLGIKARAVASSSSAPSFSGGHHIELPAADFPVRAKDSFDFDPVTGSFGRADALSLRGASFAALDLAQSSAWTPADSVLDRGLLLQTWDGSLSLGTSLATVGLSAKNLSRPTTSLLPGGPGADYASAWIGAFAYALPAFESDSQSREATATMSIKAASGKDLLAASLGESAQPAAAGGGDRRDSASVRLSLPIEAGWIAFAPYYSRSWKDRRFASSTGMLGDAEAALGDFKSLPVLYRGLPFVELVSPDTAADFAEQSAPGGLALPEASLAPEAGITMSREYGSLWYDLALPSALGFSYQRLLARAADQVTDTGLWSTTAKIAAVNLFGTMGAYPLGLPFDSDEYLSTLQATLKRPRDGSASSLNLQYQSLCTLYSGQTDRLDVESRLALSEIPDKLDWTASIGLSLSVRALRHWLSDLYSMAAGAAGPARATATKAPGDEKRASIASLFLSDLATRTPNVRTALGLKAGLSGLKGDAAAPTLGWSLVESYQAKLTVPERLTVKIDLGSSQALDKTTRTFTLGLELGMNVVISF